MKKREKNLGPVDIVKEVKIHKEIERRSLEKIQTKYEIMLETQKSAVRSRTSRARLNLTNREASLGRRAETSNNEGENDINRIIQQITFYKKEAKKPFLDPVIAHELHKPDLSKTKKKNLGFAIDMHWNYSSYC
jgi:hypothetical protein